MMIGGESSIPQTWATRLLRNPFAIDANAEVSSDAGAVEVEFVSGGESNLAVSAMNDGDDHANDATDKDAHDGETHGDAGHGDQGHGDQGHSDQGHGGGGHGADHYLDQGHLLEHVGDAPHFEYSGWLFGHPRDVAKRAEIPQPFQTEQPIVGREGSTLLPLDFKVTKFMAIELMVALVLIAVFVPLAQKIRTGAAPKGKLWNLLEVLLVYIRDQVARPSIGKHDADKYMPFLWTIFFFVLFCNLFGLIPFLGSPTGSLAVTGVLALATFGVVLWTGISKLGFLGFFKAQVPHMDLPFALALVIVPMIFAIEVLGLFMKHFVLALRLFANMFAGHLVLAVLLGLIAANWESNIVYLVAPASIFASIGVNLLELFVAFLQAYIFTFLSALFIGAAAHPH